MHRKITYGLLMLVAILAIPFRVAYSHGSNIPNPQIFGTWVCEGQRADPQGVIHSFPINFTFHMDGTMTYSSGSKIDHRGYNDRGGAQGQFEKIGKNLYRWSSVEITYFYPTYSVFPDVIVPTVNDPEDFAGRLFVVDGTSKLDPENGTLCSGRAECPGTATPVVFCKGFGDNETCAAPVPANSFCYRLDDSLP